ncbi:MCD, Malonyl-CoA decarboxylase MCD [Tardiphaga sp. vice352]|uniref:malonyl-CoA decarboxylase n=1 Tax=unclassified Tardiphaga TaxID=2631404 RepID=UPI001162C427|nr:MULTISPECIES: malonyl-CoA decarboxylase [unclassified Tardiphaga]QDM16180.1 MCD, Malonyl-CoA decarboxylase MCD [Tardiphaga sp. vice278]QDM21207.1 MCD, Malonyl-CoA decarboxylase MCD [Tardiphaga sp. vice154]QDM26389.1 MCD, Malonyl-CoA decarboxylase MCD [Tardiphaga sp. vice304]QDM31457.1 MCD, Malonyl-CoA decarboxylase MCD [Tardiphaga sp. vice352]
MSNDFFSDLLASISERGRTLLRLGPASVDARQNASDLVELCTELLSGRGEASGTAIARGVFDRYHQLDEAGRLTFFETMASQFGPDADRLERAIAAWHNDPSGDTAGKLHFASEPRRQELLRRLNRAPGATGELVNMRADLLDLKGAHKELAVVDRDCVHLLASWFNRGFLVLRRIDWSTPAIILEKVIKYEAVHEIHDWNDLRRRIDPVDRRCYAFFHPALVDEPLIFVEVALTETIPGAIAPLLAEDRQPVAIERARTAVFYSISNCQRGLGGISFGNFLIKQVVEELRRELPKLESFVTLSPVPGFMKWLQRAPDVPITDEERTLLAHLDDAGWINDAPLAAQIRTVLEPLAAHYFLKAKSARGGPVDSVARFHLGNGARLERIDWLGDVSMKGLRESAGLMVNYLYRLDDIEKNHEAYADHYEIAASSAVKKQLKTEGRRLLDMRLG